MTRAELLEALTVERFWRPRTIDPYHGLATPDDSLTCSIRRRDLAVALGLIEARLEEAA